MNNYPECLISAIRGLLNDYTITEIIEEFFKKISISELKNKLNLLERKFNKETINDYLFNYKNNFTSNERNINNIESKIDDFNLNSDINKTDDSSLISQIKQKEKVFLNLKKERELNNENNTTKNKNIRKKTRIKKSNEKSANKNKSSKYIEKNDPNNKTIYYYFKPISKEEESKKKIEQIKILNFDFKEEEKKEILEKMIIQVFLTIHIMMSQIFILTAKETKNEQKWVMAYICVKISKYISKESGLRIKYKDLGFMLIKQNNLYIKAIS